MHVAIAKRKPPEESYSGSGKPSKTAQVFNLSKSHGYFVT